MGSYKDKKLCKLVKEEFHEKKQAKYNGLINHPGYVCEKCGRAANSEDNLCKAYKLKT